MTDEANISWSRISPVTHEIVDKRREVAGGVMGND